MDTPPSSTIVQLQEFIPKQNRRRSASRPGRQRNAELFMEIVGQIVAVVDDVGLIDREHRIALGRGCARNVPMRVNGNQPRNICDSVTDNLTTGLRVGRFQIPFLEPESAVLYVEANPFERPVKPILKHCWISSPVGEVASDRNHESKEAPQIRREHELELSLKCLNFGIRQPRLHAINFRVRVQGSEESLQVAPIIDALLLYGNLNDL